MLENMASSPDSSTSGKLAAGISPHLNPRFSRIKNDYHKRLFNYEKEFNIKTNNRSSRGERLLRESMLAYTERIRNISNPVNRYDSDESDTEDKLPLFIRAKHIPKYPAKRSLPRRPASLDELIGKSNLVKQEKDRILKRPKSASRVPPRISLPALPDRIQGRSHHVKISFVSASDLYDFVDYSLRNRGTKKETLQFLQMEKDILTKKAHEEQKRPAAAHTRTGESPRKPRKENNVKTLPSLPPIDSKNKEKEDNIGSPEIIHNKSTEPDNTTNEAQSDNLNENGKKSPVVPLKVRPNRAKRMKIRQPDLGAIPEHDVSSHHSRETPERLIASPPPKISPKNIISLDSNLRSIPENDTNYDNGFPGKKKLSRLSHRSKLELNHPSPFGKVDSLLTNEKRIIDLDDLDINSSSSNKLKAQKKFKKLIFLRDIPDRK